MPRFSQIAALAFVFTIFPALARGNLACGDLACGDLACGDLARGDQSTRHVDSAPELAEFDFLIGSWTCSVDALGADWTTRSQSTAQWNAYYIQGGRAIMDDFRGGFGEDYLATTIRAYDRRAETWSIRWIHGATGVWSDAISGRAVEGGMLLETTARVPTADGTTTEVALQYEFFDIESDRFQWRQNASVDGGESWRRDTVRMDCRRVASSGEESARGSTEPTNAG